MWCIVLTKTDYTTQEYLERVRHTNDAFLSPSDLAITCFTLLSFDHPSSLLSQNPLLEYAALGWAEHSRGFDDCPTVAKYAVELLRDVDRVKLVNSIVFPPTRLYPQGLNASGLHLCSFFGLRGIAEGLLKEGQNPDLPDNEGGRPLHYAAEKGHQQMVELLLKTGQVDADARGKYGWSPLFVAVGNEHDGVVKLLLETGKVDVNVEDKHGRTPLYWAVYMGNEGVLTLLLKTGQVEIDARDEDGKTSLLMAAYRGYEGVAKLLLETGKVDVNARDQSGRTSLHWAAELGHERVVELLLKTGKVDIACDGPGWTPLFSAVAKGHKGIVKLLREFRGNAQ